VSFQSTPMTLNDFELVSREFTKSPVLHDNRRTRCFSAMVELHEA